MTLYRRQESRPSPRKRNAKKTKWLSEEALQIAVKRRKRKKGKIYPFECRIPKNSKERLKKKKKKKPFAVITAKK